jgi:hypothetical protein
MPPPTPPPSTGSIVGRVELAEGVPAAGAKIRVRGAPFAATCDPFGGFGIGGIPSGRWTMVVSHPVAAGEVRVVIGLSSGEVANVGLIRLNARGSISGRVVFLDPDHYATAVVAVPELGIVAQPNARGGYLLEGVAAGQREVVLIHALYASAPPKRSVLVKALANVVAPDFVRRPPKGESALVDFGIVLTGSVPRVVWHLWNPDAVSAAVTQVRITGTDAARFSADVPAPPLTVGATGLEIPLTVNTSVEGSFAAELHVQGAAETLPLAETVALKATVSPPPTVQLPDIRTTPTEVDFGSLPGGPSTAVIELRNDGAADGTVEGTIAPPLFQLVDTPFPLVLAPGAKAQITVRALNPGASGAVTAYLKLTWQPGQGSRDLKLKANWS